MEKGNSPISAESASLAELRGDFIGLNHLQPILGLVLTQGFFAEAEFLKDDGVSVSRLEGNRIPIDFQFEEPLRAGKVSDAVAFLGQIDTPIAAGKGQECA